MGSQGSRETERRQVRHRAFEARSRQMRARVAGRYPVWRRYQAPLRPVITPPEGAPARISHQVSAAVADLRALTNDLGPRLLDVPPGTPPGPRAEIVRQNTHLHDFATRPGEKCGLGVGQDVSVVDDVSLDQSSPQIVRHWTESPREKGGFDAADSL